MLLSLSYILLFYVFSLFASIASFPIMFSLFSYAKDRGYAFSKLFFFLLLSAAVWFVGMTIHIPFTFFSIFALIFITLIFSIFIYRSKAREINNFLIHNKRLIFFEEVFFIAAFIIFLIIRFGNPDLWHPVMGGEKPMDMAFINALIKTNVLPPYDPWFAGESMNYYYFGQFITATLVKLLGIPSSFFYNIFLSFLFAQTFLGMLALVHTLTGSKKAGIIGGFFLVGIGNLAQIPVILKSFALSPPINGWYWTATRIMPNYEINEFPFFTFLYADLHSHLIALPIGLFFVYLCYELLKTKTLLKSVVLSIVLGIVLGILRMTNVWDFPTFSCALIVTGFCKFFIDTSRTMFLKKFLNVSLFLFIAFSVSLIVTTPFALNYKTGALGLSFFHGPFTKIGDYILINGFFLFILGSYALIRLKSFSLKKIPRVQRAIIILPIAVFVLSLIFMNSLIFFIGIFLMLMSLVLIIPKRSESEQFAIFIAMFGLFLTIIPDVIDIQLALGRMNTVFKFYFQAWIFFAISSSYFFYYITRYFHPKKLYKIWLLVFLLLFACVFSYIPTATTAKILDRMSKVNTLTLDGEEYMKRSMYTDNNRAMKLIYDYEAIRWMNKNITKPQIILEAATPIYHWGSRISIYTGLPTVLGWDWHEIAHRQYISRAIVDERTYHIRQIYESDDTPTSLSLLGRYHVKFIYIGQLEKAYYDTRGIEDVIGKNPNVFKEIYMNNQTKLYVVEN